MTKSALPTHAGTVPLEFIRGLQQPVRLPDSLRIPIQDGMEFHPLQGGRQFVLHLPRRANTGQFTVFFGGEDESPFITPIAATPLVVLRSKGETGFYESLTPTEIKFLRIRSPDAPVRRQGDVWSIRLPDTWSHFDRCPRTQKQRTHVLGTNHILTGRYLGKRIVHFDDGLNDVRVALGEGVMTARDHAPQTLEGGPHAFARTPHLNPISLTQRDLGWQH